MSLADDVIDEKSFYNKLLLNSQETEDDSDSLYDTVVPKPGRCVKTSDENGKKIFINICTSYQLPKPAEVEDSELVKILDSQDPSLYRIPISLGDSREELDKSGSVCRAYDVVVHPHCLERSDVYQQFIYVVALEGLEDKYDVKLSRDFVVLKNKRCLGTPREQRIRRKAKPWISDMTQRMSAGDLNAAKRAVKQKVMVEESRCDEPRYQLVKRVVDGKTSEIRCVVHLPKVVCSASVNLEVGEDRLLLVAAPDKHRLDIFLPLMVDQLYTTATFNRTSRKLDVVMPVQKR